MSAALLLGVGAPVQIAAGWVNSSDRVWWLTGAGLAVGVGTILSLLPAHNPPTGSSRTTSRDLLEGQSDSFSGDAGEVVAGPIQQPTGVNPGTGTQTAQEHAAKWTIPPPVRSFTDREELLTLVREQLKWRRSAALVPMTALHGMGGVGKTQLAMAYARQYRADYELGWWIPAETELSITNALTELAVALGLPAKLPFSQLTNRVNEVLARRTRWLLVIDNVTDPVGITRIVPGLGEGHVLLTSRTTAWQGVADAIGVDVLPLDHAVALLSVRSGDHDREAAEALAEELGCLPLALEQAAAYASQYLAGRPRPLARYLELFRERRADLLARGRPLAYEGTVDATFTLALDRLRETSVAAAQLLEVCALLAPDELPVKVLLSRPGLLPDRLAVAGSDPLSREETLGLLYQAGLLAPDGDDSAGMHRLVQIVTLAHLPDPDRHERIAQTVALLADLFPPEGWEPDTWPRCAQFLIHARMLVGHVHEEQIVTHAGAELLTAVGDYLWGRGLNSQDAQDMYEQALAMRQRLHAGDHPDIAQGLHKLAITAYQVGDGERTRDLAAQALAMRQRLHTGDHPDIARCLTALAQGCWLLGDLVRARDLATQALAMRQRLHTGDHPDIGRSLHGLGIFLRALGDAHSASEFDLQALEMRRRLLGADHPAVAYSLNNLAVDFRMLDEHVQAQALAEQALSVFQQLYEREHRDLAISLHNLASDLYYMGELERARELDEQALSMVQRLYGEDHAAVADSITNLAVDVHSLGDVRRARQLDEQAASLRQRPESEHSSEVPDNLSSYAFTLDRQGQSRRTWELDD